MEQHPIPQNVTTFQFRLIGDMTIKQFGFLAVGGIAGYVCYKLPLPAIIALPLAVLCVLLGIGLAFVPIEERPMDVWILSFIKSIYSPTLYVWQKTETTPQSAEKTSTLPTKPANYGQFGAIPGLKEAMAISESIETYIAKYTTRGPRPAIPPQKTTPPSAVASGQPVIPAYDTERKPAVSATLEKLYAPTPRATSQPTSNPELPRHTVIPGSGSIVSMKTRGGFLEWLATVFTAKHAPYEPREVVPQVSTPSLTGKPYDLIPPPQSKKETTPDLQKATIEAAKLQKTVDDLKKELEGKTASDARVLELQKQLMDLIAHRDKMEAELIELRRKVIDKKPVFPFARQAAPNASVADQKSTIRVVTSDSAPKMGLPRLTTFPNVVTGLIKDTEGNLLPGVLITVRDKEGVPLRALKSNKLGQFAASTPLPKGTYFVEVEDPRNRYIFDRAQITLNGNIMPALAILAKSQKEVARAKLEKEIFGNQM